MGMYTQVCGVLNVGSRTWRYRVGEVSHAVQKAAGLSSCEYWPPERLLEHATVLSGGSGSVFIAIAVEGKIIGYGKDWQNFINNICTALPTAEGRIEWIYEEPRGENSDSDEVWRIHNGEISITWEKRYRNGYGNGC